MVAGFVAILVVPIFGVAVIGFVDLAIFFLVALVVCLTIFFAPGLAEVFFAIFVIAVFDAGLAIGLVIGLAEVTGAAMAIPPKVRAPVSARI